MDLIVSTHMVAQTEKTKDMAEIEKKRFECLSRVYLNGFATFPIMFGSLFITQRASIKFVSPLALAGISAGFAGMGTYLVVDTKMKECAKSAQQLADIMSRAIKSSSHFLVYKFKEKKKTQ